MYIREYVTIPCGKCIGCRLEYSRQWANRCMLELSYHKSSYFLTLTYNDSHLPISSFVDEDTGEILESATLLKRDFQLFMKRLRKKFGSGLRYYMCGEYGSKTFRPHYHVIIFGLELNDLEFYKRSPNGDNYYISKSVNDCWSIRDSNGNLDPIGHVIIGNVTWESCAYTARYVMKKASGVYKKVYTDLNILPEFVLMSRRPGIGYYYFLDNKDTLYNYDFINISTEKTGLKFRPPKYFDKLAERFDIDLDFVKENRKSRSENYIKLKLAQTDLSYLDLLKVEENNLYSRIKSLSEGRQTI